MREDTKLVLGMLTAYLLIWFLLAYGLSYMEARAYERVTGKHVSAWDAMFIKLQVQEPAITTQDN